MDNPCDHIIVGRPSGSITYRNNFDLDFSISGNDPLCQTHSLARSEHCFRLKYVLFCKTLKCGDVRTYGQHVRKQWSLPAVTVGRPSGSRLKQLVKKLANSVAHLGQEIRCYEKEEEEEVEFISIFRTTDENFPLYFLYFPPW